MVNVTWIKRFDGDWGAHCNSCEHLAVYSVSLRSASFRLCESCAEKLCADLDGVLAMKVRKHKRQPTKRAADSPTGECPKCHNFGGTHFSLCPLANSASG
mgnify:CR=1 FL=1